mmetsp:Transcript_19264/g.58164  ORF Transcript_19264/g.58164 Transcript_19264/m.58164 type:complete len:324 (-) Transcript_19264:298-1269(-)|eukprot:CAMPEP_0206141254 /NCGR_PEP_ID=MMETSP1473-20131121/12266_1 /ASSEMBLY_ACC=CAM_ASM_001109 /TAXON_ID=1461547 /ORGANISM="Stichococcus sp, Strain RCC1054" /LENGTH=323 /DNA_ID=CAMNT_0053535743 /DNA_START=37 /DNA_END=1008 /DNA_ORIENTATION=+
MSVLSAGSSAANAFITVRAPRHHRCNRVVAVQAHSNAPAATPSHQTTRRGALAAVVTLAAVAFQPRHAAAEEAASAVDGLAGAAITAAADVASSAAAAPPQTVYFGNGCFWGRQKDFVDVERESLKRAPEQVSAVVGYAGGRQTGPDGRICYYYGPGNTVYEKLGHAEVTQVELGGGDTARTAMQAFADKYFAQFRKTPFGMMRLDPQDAGPGYRNVIGIPGGVNSELFEVLKERNVNNMDLREGDGNSPKDGDVNEPDRFNTVWILDSNKLPFYRAEDYHQFHDGIGHPFSADYKVEQRAAAEKAGRIGPTGCPEGGFFGFT